MKKILIIILFLLISASAYAATPVIFYSDLTSGPNSGGQSNNGVFVTIWGNNFGSSQGSSSIKVGGGTVASYPVWTNTKVTFQLGSSAATGSIVLTTSAGSSNGISFTVRSGAIYFVNPAAGSNGTGTFASPFNHIWYAYNVQAAGDTVYIETGTINDEIDGCSGWHAVVCVASNVATSSSPVAYVAYPGETVTISIDGGTATWTQGSSGGSDNVEYVFRAGNSGNTYNVISQINMAMTGTSGNLNSEVSATQGWRIVGNNLTANVYVDDQIDFTGDGVEVLGNTIHDSGAGYGSQQNESHSIYNDGPSGTSTPFEIGWNYMYNNQLQGWEIQSYHNGPRIGTIHDNLIVASEGAGSDKGILADGSGDGGSGNPDTYSTMYTNSVKVYNNVLVNTGTYEAGGNLQAVCGTNYIYNNTFYYSGAESKGMIQFPNVGCGPSGGDQVIYFADNIMYANQSGLYLSDSNGNAPTWTDFTVLAKNIYYGEGNGPTNDTTAINSNPLLVSPTTTTSGNWAIGSGSPAIGAGYNTNSIVANDYNGVSRPNPPSIGAYEYLSSVGDIYTGSLTIKGINFK